MAFTALFDACVLYPAPLRDLLIRTACTGAYRARWTERIHEEWTHSLLANRPELEDQIGRSRALMDKAVPDCLIAGYEALEGGLILPDDNDRHVLAAAIVGRADVIVTYNLKDFPPENLKPYGIEAQHPDDFLRHLYDINQPALLSAVRAQREALRKPPYTARELLDIFLERELASTVAVLEPNIALI
jgi:PIN domain